MLENEISNKIIGLALQVHTALGPGLLESAYRECLYFDLVKSGLQVEKEKLRTHYKGQVVEYSARLDGFDVTTGRKRVISFRI